MSARTYGPEEQAKLKRIIDEGPKCFTGSRRLKCRT